MESRPKISVIGSCVSRDVFSSSTIPNYKEKVNVISEVFQSSIISLARESSIPITEPTSGIKASHVSALKREFGGENLHRVTESRPDYIIIDLFSDIHFGVTKVLGHYVTRNHMAFTSNDYANLFYKDTSSSYPDRAKYEHPLHRDEDYLRLIVNSLASIREKVCSKNPRASFIVNSARYSTSYINDHGQQLLFNRPQLDERNGYWGELDTKAIDALDAIQIKHPDELFIANQNHRWGLHPVHYTKDYYLNLWRQIEEITQ